MIQALQHAEAELGVLQFAASCPAVRIDFEEPLADVAAADVAAFANPQSGRNDPSFFFLRGSAAVRAFDCALRAVTAK